MKPNKYGRKFGFKYSHFGSDQAGHDIKAYGDTTDNYFFWDASANTLYIKGNLSFDGALALDDITLADNEVLNFGSSSDVVVKYDGTDLIWKKAAATGTALTIDADTVDTTNDVVLLDVGVNSSSVAAIKQNLDVKTALSGGEIVRGLYIDANGIAANADTSGIYGIDLLMTATSTDRADLIGYKIATDGSMDTADTIRGVYVDFDNTMATSTQYGLHIDGSGMTHTSGTLYGLYAQLPTAASGTSTVMYSHCGATSTGLYIDSGTTDRTSGNCIEVNLDVNNASCSLLKGFIDWGTVSASSAKTIRGIFLDINDLTSGYNGSGIIGSHMLITGVTGGNSDLVGYKVEFDGVKDQGDTTKGIHIIQNGLTINHASEILYGEHLDFSSLTHTNGTVYGKYIDVSATATAGTTYGIYESLGLSGIGLYMSGTAGKITKSMQITSNSGRADIDVEIDNLNRFELFDDFLYQTITEVDTPWILNSDGGASDAAITTLSGGAIRLTTADNDDRVQVISSIPVQATDGGLSFETRIKVDNITSVQIIAGLTDTTTLETTAAVGGGDAITTTLSDGCVFVYDTASDADKFFAIGVSNNTDATGNASTGIAPVNGTWIRLRIGVSSDGSSARFYINDTLYTTLTANATRNNVNLYGFVSLIGNTLATTRNLDVDYIKVGCNR